MSIENSFPTIPNAIREFIPNSINAIRDESSRKFSNSIF